MSSPKSKAFWQFYAVTALAISAAAAFPLWNFFAMLRSYRWVSWPNYNVTAIIPFAAASAAILLGFLLLPALWRMSARKRRIIALAAAAGIFVTIQLHAEMLAARLDTAIVVMTSRMMHPPELVAFLETQMAIPWAVRIHYYIFSVVLILAALNFLYCLFNTLFGDGKPGKRSIALQGGAVVCYLLAYLFVRVMQYEDHGALLLTGWSVLNAAICFILAAVAAGLLGASFISFKGPGKFIPPLLSTATVLALYGAQYVMLGGNFYLYHENAAVTVFLRILVIIIPGITVFFLHKKGSFTPPSPRPSSSL